MKKALFLDRDGTIIHETEDEQIDSFEKMRFLTDAIYYLRKIVDELDYHLVMVTNQDGLGTESFPEDTFWPVHEKILQILADHGISFYDVHIDKTFPHEGADTRKPGTGMLAAYMDGTWNLEESVVVGDRESDVELATNLGAQAIFIGDHEVQDADLCTTSWQEIYQFLRRQKRKAEVHRKTSETDIRVDLNIDGSGTMDIDTGIGFLDHMLEQLAKHGGLDLSIKVKGDLQIDEHHTVEDTALALGEAFRLALGDKRGMYRYGFLLPMDDALAQVAIDFGGRPWLVWEVQFNREKVGALPTELVFHFFKSFADEARCNLNINAAGDNEHHKIEAIFKGFARAIRMAVTTWPEGADEMPSTKGVI